MTDNDRVPIHSGSGHSEPELVAADDAARIRGGMLQVLPVQLGTCISTTRVVISAPPNRPRRWPPVPDGWWDPPRL